MKHVLLICGSGASSGFMAAAIRKAAKKKGEEISVKAASEAQLDDWLDQIDTLLIGPHLAYIKDDVTAKTAGKNIQVAIIPQAIYGTLDGTKALEMINKMEG